MIRVLFVLALPLLFLHAEDAKPEPKPVPTERQLTKEESLAFRVFNAQRELLQDKYRIRPIPAPQGSENWNEDITPINTEQQALVKAVCKSVGVPEDRPEQCGINSGYDPFGKPILGVDGKPLPAKVWWVKPPAPPSTDKK